MPAMTRGSSPRVIGTNVIALFEIRRRARLEGLALQRLVAAIGARSRLVDFRLYFGRQSKKRGGLREHVLDQRLRDAVIFDIEKAFVETGGAQLGADGRSCRKVPARQSRNVDDGQRSRRHPRRFKCVRHLSFPDPASPGASCSAEPFTSMVRNSLAPKAHSVISVFKSKAARHATSPRKPRARR